MDEKYTFKKLSKIEKIVMNVGSFIMGMGLGCLANYLSLVGETGNLNVVDKLGHTLVITAISLGVATKTYFDAPILKKVYEQQICSFNRDWGLCWIGIDELLDKIILHVKASHILYYRNVWKIAKISHPQQLFLIC